MTLAEKIRTARREAGLTQGALAEKMGVTDKLISAYEKGRSIPPLKRLKQLTEFTHFLISYFTGDEDIRNVLIAKLTNVEKLLNEVKQLMK